MDTNSTRKIITVDGFTVALTTGRLNGELYFTLDGINCDLHGEQPGMYFPTPLESTRSEAYSHIGPNSEFIGAGDDVAVLSSDRSKIEYLGVLVDAMGNEAIVRPDDASEWRRAHMDDIAHPDSPQAEAVAMFGQDRLPAPEHRNSDGSDDIQDAGPDDLAGWNAADIQTLGDVHAFLGDVVAVLGHGFHPDTPFNEYESGELVEAERVFNDEQAARLTATMTAAFAVCQAARVDLYAVALLQLNAGEWPVNVVDGSELGDLLEVTTKRMERSHGHLKEADSHGFTLLVGDDEVPHFYLYENVATVDNVA